mmetsp:Transcript_78581/g.234242  ORF Transcript_78581/g.234242 Transcript_78581/m.234242 type:complete len:225 (-) Transcript_78581:516-1190(-)
MGAASMRLAMTSSPSSKPTNSHLWITAAKLQGVPQAAVMAPRASVTVSVAGTCTTACSKQSSLRGVLGRAARRSESRRTPSSSSSGTSTGQRTSSRDLKTTTASAPAPAAARAADVALSDCSAAWKALAQRRRERNASDSATCSSPRSRILKHICASNGSSGAPPSGPSCSQSGDSSSSRGSTWTRLRRGSSGPRLCSASVLRPVSPTEPWLCRKSTARISGRE